MGNILQEKKFSFFFILSVLLISLTIFLLTNDTKDLFPYPSLSYIRSSSSQPYLLPASPAPSLSEVALTQQDNDSSAHEKPTAQTQNDDDDLDELGESWNVSLNVDWKRCDSPDYIPCLDNMKAIKRLKSEETHGA